MSEITSPAPRKVRKMAYFALQRQLRRYNQRIAWLPDSVTPELLERKQRVVALMQAINDAKREARKAREANDG